MDASAGFWDLLAHTTGVTLLDSAFWTFHPVYCRDVHIHHMEIQVPWLAHVDGQNISGFNGDGIDVDSCQDVLIEHNYINCGDDHVTILAGVGKAGQDFGMPSRNITVADNRLGSGMGLSVGSSVSGGVEDVLYTRNVMNETSGQWGMGVHIVSVAALFASSFEPQKWCTENAHHVWRLHPQRRL
mgnify:CR=1 FL=1